MKITYKGFTGNYQKYNDDIDGGEYFAGNIPGVEDAVILFEGETLEELTEDFHNAVDDCISQGYVQHIKKHTITIPVEMYATLKERATSSGVSVASYTRKLLASVLL